MRLERGAHDATCDGSDCHLYITVRKGFDDHSPEFNKNYMNGFCAATHNQGGSDADDATFDCNNDNN